MEKSRLSTGLRVVGVLRLSTWVLVAAWATSSLWYPFGWDQGIIAWVGSTILDGGMPYRDAFDLKGPVAYYTFAAAQALFGHNLWGIRLFDLIGLAGSGFLLASVTRRYTESTTGWWAAALFVLWFAGLTFWHTAQPDGFAAMLLCFGLLPLLSREGTSFRGSAWAGLMIGLCVGIKPPYAAFWLVPAVYYWLALRHQPGRALARIAVAGVTVAATVGLILVWFAHRGALDSLVEVHLRYNAQAYSSGAALAVGERLRGLFEYVLQGGLFVVLAPAALLGAVHLHRTHRTAAWTLVAWAATATAIVVLQNKFFAYQWTPLFPPVVILGVVGFHAALIRNATPQFGLVHALLAVTFVHAWTHPAYEVANWASYVVGLRDRAGYYDTFGVPGDDYRMAEYIESHSDAEDRLVVLGWNQEILYMTNRRTVSRLAFSLPVWMGEGSPLREAYRDELMGDLRSSLPELIVVAEQAEPLIGRPVSLDDFAAFQTYLADRYEPEVDFGPLSLYRLRSGER